MDCNAFREAATQAGHTFTIVCPSDDTYDHARQIANSRFDLHPAAIAYCETAAHVGWCITYCRDTRAALRIRSGGHQHEGMCSSDGVVIVDLSKIDGIEYVGAAGELAWIGAGKRLGDVYRELEARHRIIPGGGCGTVCVGGLTQGGGWGPSARLLGLTCDNMVEAEVVLANGETVVASETNAYADLFWAMRGGGGGNFGVATRFLFKLHPLSGTVTTFELHWGREAMLDVTRTWMTEASTRSEALTTFCRLSVVGEDTGDRPAVLVGGQFYGPVRTLLGELERLYDVAHPIYERFESHRYPERPHLDLAMASDGRRDASLASRQAYLGSLLQPAAAAAPTNTCDGPHPHKVSSAFPKHRDYGALAERIRDYLGQSEPSARVNAYLSLHGMGGAVTNVPATGSAFPYRDKDFMLQFQAWWVDGDGDAARYIAWVEECREALRADTEGAFINFPDKDLVADPDTQRVELLTHYYGENLDRLRGVKRTYDPDNVFSFGMNIPPAG